ncbi:helix-turn-helix domain-containing protein [Phenylobacterium sp.]|uniref:helix-turn-helix domain-containing protein n=1 Tax=Phenylobacterium sp. TaxID=1871053 RepID=UPI002F410317
MRHAPRETLARHLHDHAFAAVVLCGGYVEAGDTGRHWMEAGDVLLHQAWESHLDRFGRRGAEVLVLEIDDAAASRLSGRIADPDALVRLAERDRAEAARLMLAELGPKPSRPADWPDLLAQALNDDPALCLGAWADARGLRLGSVSRGFRQVFGMAPVGYRLVQRTRRAIAAVRATAEPLSFIAQDCGFADQAHMSRAIRRLARTTPAALRKAA